MKSLDEVIRQRVLKFLRLEHLADNPNGDRYTYLGDPDNIVCRKIEECKVWYYGDSNELLNFYTAMQSYGNAENPIYNRNKKEYFWGLSSEECDIKRIHSGIPNAIVTTLTNIVGIPEIHCEGKEEQIKKIIDKAGLANIINQKQMPMTLALGWGAFKPVIDTDVCTDSPLIEWYDADKVEFICKHGVVIGIVYKDYYKYKNKDYVLLETRRLKEGNSLIEYNLYRLEKSDQVVEVELSTIPDLANLPKEGLEIPGFNKLLGVPSIFFYDPNNENYGKSILADKLDLFDDLDQDLSQASQTCRVSTPVEYYPSDLLQRTRDGRPKLPKRYNRQYEEAVGGLDGDGHSNGQIITTQPQLNFAQYNEKVLADLNMCMTGKLAPSTLGINIAKDDTALSQREKEKVSIMMRNNIIDRQTWIVKTLVNLLLAFEEYMTTGAITVQDYDVSVKFNEFCNPSFETVSQNLANLLANNAITPELYVEKLYGDSLSDEEKAREVAYIKERQQADTLDFGDFENDEQFTANPEQQAETQIGPTEAE